MPGVECEYDDMDQDFPETDKSDSSFSESAVSGSEEEESGWYSMIFVINYYKNILFDEILVQNKKHIFFGFSCFLTVNHQIQILICSTNKVKTC